MRYFMPDSSDLSGKGASQRSIDTVPTGMENDPNADEEVINQTANGRNIPAGNHTSPSPREEYPEPVKKEKEAKLTPDKLADSIAYALDGSGPGPTEAKPNVSGHDVITEGTSGAGPEEKEALFGK